MICPKCGGQNVTVQLVETGTKGKKSGVGLGGHINNAARGIMAISTLGMSNLVWKKAKGTSSSKTITKKVCLCQGCGNSWKIE